MIKSFNSWSTVTEAIASGKDTMIDPVTGKRHKITYRVQSNTKFVIKIINDLDIIKEDKLTVEGIKALTDYLNQEDPFTMAIGQLTPSFFTNNFIVYTVLRDGELFGRTKQKIQFSIEKRKDDKGNKLYPSIADNVNFIDSVTFSGISSSTTQIVSQLTATAQQAQLPDPSIENEAEPAPKTGTEETKKERGKKFLYTMRLNSKLYEMEFTEAGTITAKTKDGSDPNGTISFDQANKKVYWATTLDDATSKDTRIGKAIGGPLFTDVEILNQVDKDFFVKIFTDTDFRNKIIDDYEKEHMPFEINPENLKKMLFYKDGKAMFGEVTPVTPNAEKENALVKSLQALKGTI